MSSQNLDTTTVSSMKYFELRKLGKEYKIKYWYRMNRETLVEKITEHILLNNIKNELTVPKLRREYTVQKCSGLKINHDKLEKCETLSNHKYCDEHSHKYRLEKPDDCPICMENISNETETPLHCGHWVHKECLKLTNVEKCPVCREKMTDEEIMYIFGKIQLYHMPQMFNRLMIFYGNEVDSLLENISSEYDFYYDEQNENNDLDDDDEELSDDDDVDDGRPRPELNYLNDEDIIQEITNEILSRRRDNSYVTMESALTCIPIGQTFDYFNYVNRIISETLNVNPNIIPVHLVSIELRGNFVDNNLLSICYNILNNSDTSVTAPYYNRILDIVRERIHQIRLNYL